MELSFIAAVLRDAKSITLFQKGADYYYKVVRKHPEKLISSSWLNFKAGNSSLWDPPTLEESTYDQCISSSIHFDPKFGLIVKTILRDGNMTNGLPERKYSGNAERCLFITPVEKGDKYVEAAVTEWLDWQAALARDEEEEARLVAMKAKHYQNLVNKYSQS